MSSYVVSGPTTIGTSGQTTTIQGNVTLPDTTASQGSVFYAGASMSLTALAPGTSGYVLTTQGSNADPIWAPGGGGGTSVFFDNAFTVENVSDDTKKVMFSLGGMSSGTLLTLASQQSTNSTLTIPSINSLGDTVVTAELPQTLTNKNITDVGSNVTASGLFTNSTTVGVSAANAPSVGQSLVATSPSSAAWQNVSASSLTGVVAVTNGGTGNSSLSTGNVLVGNGTSPITATMAAPAGAFVGTTDTQTLTAKTITDTSNHVTASALFAGGSPPTTTINVGSATVPTVGQVLTLSTSSPNYTATWQTPSPSGIATELGTTGGPGPVVINTNYPTSSGQVLVSTSSTNATWQTPASSSTFFDNAFLIENATQPSKHLNFDLSGQTNTTELTLATLQSTSQVLTFPNITAADTVSTVNLPQQLYSKTITDTGSNVTASSLFVGGNPPTQTINVSGATTPSVGQVLTIGSTSPYTATWQTPSAGGAASELATSASPVVINTNFPTSAGQVLVSTDPTNATWQNISAGNSISAATVFQDGSDGSVTVTTNTSLTQDMYYSTLTINNGVTLSSEGFMIFVEGAVTINGVIASNGGAGGNASSGSAGAGGGGALAGTLGGGGDGVSGVTGSSSGMAGDSVIYAVGGGGGSGGGGSSSGGAGGTANTPPKNVGGSKIILHRTDPFTILQTTDGVPVNGGAGGASGGGNAGVGAATGGGGGGGGVILLAANTISGTGSIQANGGNAGSSYSNGSPTGGSGGGGGGLVYVISTTGLGSVTATANGGSGSPGQSGGNAGSNGSGGHVVSLLVL